MSFKKIAHSLNTYLESKDNQYLDEIEDTFKSLFSSEFVKFWIYDSRKKTLLPIQDIKKNSISLDDSLTKQAIGSKSAVVAKHVISDKSYFQQVDNPLDLKVKALLVLPILKNEKIIGVLHLAKGLKQKKVFTRQDEEKLKTFMPLFVKIIEKSRIDKEELLAMTGGNITETVPKKTNKEEVKDKVQRKDKTNNSEVQELNILNKKILRYEENEEKYKRELLKLNKQIENNLKNTQELRVEIASYIQKDKENSIALLQLNTLEKNEEKYKKEKYLRKMSENNYLKLETSALELSNLIEEYKNTEIKLSKEINLLKIENKHLEQDLKKSSTSINKSIKELKAKNAFTLENKVVDIEKNIENMLEYVAINFKDSEKLHLLFGLIICALHSKSSMVDLENIFNKSKILPEIINGYYFKGHIRVNNEKEMLWDLTNTIKKYGDIIFGSEKIKIEISNDFPTSLIIDAPKIKNIIYHLLVDIYQFVDYNKNINILFEYKNKILIIKIYGTFHEESSLFKSMFNQVKLIGNEKDRLGLLLSKKLIDVLHGNIETLYDKERYTFMVKLPAKKIKI